MAKRVLEFNPPESRVYNFPNGEKVCLYDIVRIIISESGLHYVEHIDSYSHEIDKIIVNSGWISIEVVAEFWEFPEDLEEYHCDCGNECPCKTDAPAFQFERWSDEDKLEMCLAISDLMNSPAVQRFFDWMEQHGD
jgi:hypothetical protein